MAMEEVLSPAYATFSQELPPGSKSIWDIVEGDFEHYAPKTLQNQDKEALLVEFLSRFFAPGVVNNVMTHIKALPASVLGVTYMLGKPFPALGVSVIDGIWAQQQKDRLKREPLFHVGSSGGSGDDEDMIDVKAWPAIEEEERQKTICRRDGDGVTISERLEEFLASFGPGAAPFWEPCYSSNGPVSLFHGTRVGQLPSLAYDGINPSPRVNELWGEAAFYTCNLLHYAYEFPLHDHLGQGIEDDVAVLEFTVDAAVLKGEVAPVLGESAFRVKSFLCRDERWEKWIAYHMLPSERRRLRLKKEDEESWDIVMAPVCFGGPSPDGKVDPAFSNKRGFQVAFCSDRARAWLQENFTRVFVEGPEPSAASERRNGLSSPSFHPAPAQTMP